MYGIKKIYHGRYTCARFQFLIKVKKLTNQTYETTPNLIPFSRADLLVSLPKFKQLLRNPPFGTGAKCLLYLRLRVKYILSIRSKYKVSLRARIRVTLKFTFV
jgi:hypothetical protein